MSFRVVVDTWVDGFIVLFSVALRGLVVWTFLVVGMALIHGEIGAHMRWVNWGALAWLPLCVGLELRRLKTAGEGSLLHEGD